MFAGSDFDIEQAIEVAYDAVGSLNHERLTELAGLPPVIAKRHYYETGALRWYHFAVSAPGELADAVAAHAARDGSSGAFILTLPMQGDSPAEVELHVQTVISTAVGYDPAIGVPDLEAWTVSGLAHGQAGQRGAAARVAAGFYPAMLHRQQESLLTELQVPNASEPMLAELPARARNVRGLGADHRQEAFSVRLA